MSHYLTIRRDGFRHRGRLPAATETILAERASTGFASGGHFGGVWPRDLCFAARGLVDAGYGNRLRRTALDLVATIDASSVFYTDVHPEYCAATPAEGVDTFPALVGILAACDALGDAADALDRLARAHREAFFDERRGIVAGNGSSWVDSARHPREAYNTALLLAAVHRLDAAGISTAYDGAASRIESGLVTHLWNGRYFDERRGSCVLACDANVVPLYFGLVDQQRAAVIVDSLSALETPVGHRMRARPFRRAELHPFFLLHPDYHAVVWPWSCLAYATGLRQYGFTERAERERNRVARALTPHGNFLEALTVRGAPYVKRGYASAEDFTPVADLWTEYETRRSTTDPPGSD